MVQLKKVGVLSAAKMLAFIYGVIGILVIPFVLLVGTMQTALSSAGTINGIALFVACLIIPFVYAAMGFIFGAIAAFIYNLVAGRFGGVELEFSAMPITAVAVPPACR